MSEPFNKLMQYGQNQAPGLMDGLAPDQRRRLSNALMANQYDRPTPQDGPVTERAGLLPLGTYANGQTGLAWPGFVAQPVEAFNRLLQRGYQGGTGDTQGAQDAFNVAGAAMMGGLAVPKPRPPALPARMAPAERPPDINPLAAIRLPDGRIIEGQTHVNAIMTANLADDVLDKAQAGWMVNGNFMDRDQTASFLSGRNSTGYDGLLSTERLNAKDLGQKIVKEGDGWRVLRNEETPLPGMQVYANGGLPAAGVVNALLQNSYGDRQR